MDARPDPARFLVLEEAMRMTKTPVSSVGERIGSVVVAIDSLDEVRFADRIVTSTFILALAGSH